MTPYMTIYDMGKSRNQHLNKLGSIVTECEMLTFDNSSLTPKKAKKKSKKKKKRALKLKKLSFVALLEQLI
jgi:hypothetical protein